MLNRDELSTAIDLQRRSYNLLLWLSTAVVKGVIRFDRAHDYMDEAEAAEDWIGGHYENLPLDARPKRELLKPFSRFFATYLTTSFELIKEPGHQLSSECGCYCRMCSYFVGAQNLKTKKLLPRDRERARKAKLVALQQLSIENNAHLDREQLEKMIDAKNSAADVTLLTYGHQLIERTHGRSAGPAVLALWREIAWDTTAPKKNFVLEADDIVRAEESLVTAMAGLKK
jgi:hypothetical protein